MAAGPLLAGQPAERYTFHAQRAVGAVDQIESALDVGGDLKLVEDDKVARRKMSVVAKLDYHERTLEIPEDGKGLWRSVRHYDRAVAAIQVEGNATELTLPDQRRLLGMAIEGPRVTLFCPQGPLTRDELDLVDVVGNSLLLDRLLPDRPVAIGESWEHAAELMTALVGLDAVSKADARSTLLTVTDERARFEINGQISGAIGGVSTEIELKAKYHFDRTTNRIVWFGLLIKENRSIGHIGPGLEVIARLQMTITPASQCAPLAEAALAGLTLTPTPELTQLLYRSPEGGWELLHDRIWYVYSDEGDLAVLRMVDRGEFLAQCKVTLLPNVAPGKEVALAKFQEDIKHGLGENFGQFVEAGQSSNERGYRVYRVVVDGKASDLPIRWIYYYVAEKDGRQAVLVFVVEGRLLKAFGKADEGLLRSFRFADPAVAKP